MLKYIGLAVVIGSCTPSTISDFCRQVDTIGYERLLRNFSETELRALKLDRKRALLAMRQTYETQCKGAK